ncbi:MAG: hypothetical protein ACLQHS_13975 [Candidatus Limnocylindrales bacterium]
MRRRFFAAFVGMAETTVTGVRIAVVAAVCVMSLACSSAVTSAAPASTPLANPVDAAFATKAMAVYAATT